MTDNRRLFDPEVPYQADNIADEFVDRIVLGVRRAIGKVVTPHIWRHDGIFVTQGNKLMPPRVPELGKPVE